MPRPPYEDLFACNRFEISTPRRTHRIFLRSVSSRLHSSVTFALSLIPRLRCSVYLFRISGPGPQHGRRASRAATTAFVKLVLRKLREGGGAPDRMAYAASSDLRFFFFFFLGRDRAATASVQPHHASMRAELAVRLAGEFARHAAKPSRNAMGVRTSGLDVVATDSAKRFGYPMAIFFKRRWHRFTSRADIRIFFTPPMHGVWAARLMDAQHLMVGAAFAGRLDPVAPTETVLVDRRP